MKKLSYILLCIACALTMTVSTVKADDLRGPEGGYVTDPDVMVAPGSYFAISSVYNGHRYYLGVDTTAAKSGTYQVATYDQPCLAAMWRVGGLYSPTGATLDSKDYQRMYKSEYLLEKHSQQAWLTLSGDGKTTLSLATDSASGTFFHSDKTRAAKGRYVEGSIYYFSDAMGMDTYRYLAYDALYGYSKVYSVPRPTSTMWATVWGRATGDNLSCNFAQTSYVYEWNSSPNRDVEFTLRLEEGGDRFKSRYDGTEFYATQPTITTDQATLNSRTNIDLEWASTHNNADPTTHTKSVFHSNVGDMIMITTAEHPTYSSNRYLGAITAVGAAPMDVLDENDQWNDHQDYLHVHIAYSHGGKNISSYDSVLVTRRIFQRRDHRELNLEHSPFDYLFPFATTIQQQDFTVSADYNSFTTVHNTYGTEVAHLDGETIDPLRIDQLTPIKDTVWTDDEHTAYSAVHLMDTLMAKAYKTDGVTPSDWIDTVYLTAPNQIHVVAKPYATGTSELRSALIKYTYTYRHSAAAGDTVRATQTIWVSQSPENQASATTAFYHQRGKSGLPMVGEFSRQQVPELTYTYYVIPDTANYLPVHHDHWGYYRWFIYKKGTNRGRGIARNWDWVLAPTDKDGVILTQINLVSDDFSRGMFGMRSRFNPAEKTRILAVKINTTKLVEGGVGTSAIDFDDTLAVDISAYTDTVYRQISADPLHEELTEPTLSYRQLFAMRPATESADIMASHRTGAANYMQEETMFAPIGRRFQLQPYSPYRLGNNTHEGNLQYVYYYNPNQKDTIDGNMGNSTGLTKTKGSSYNRIGLNKTTGEKKWHARLLSSDYLLNTMAVGDTLMVLMVNPRKDGGYILGATGGGAKDYKDDILSNRTDTANLRQHIEDDMLNATNFNAYKTELVKIGADKFTIKGLNYNSKFCAHVSIWLPVIGTLGEGVDWYNTTWIGGADTTITMSAYSSTSGDRITNIDPALVNLYMEESAWGNTYKGYLTAYTMEWEYYWEGWSRKRRRVYNDADIHLKSLGHEDIGGSGTINQGWCFYEITEVDHTYNHREHAKWQRKTSSDADWVTLGEGDFTGKELDGGALQTEYNGTNGEQVEYRLITQHFQLAHFTVTMRPAVGAGAQGPSTTALLPEADIEQNYDVIASFQLEEQLGAPGTSEMVAPFHHLQFNHTQFAYHYPVGNDEYHIPAAQRVTGDNILPGKGEYCIINKFENASSDYAVVEAGGGAEHGWMFCYNRANRPLVFIDFTYPKPACTDQDLVLVANFCQPNKVSQENPHIKAEYYGHRAGRPDDEWEIIFTYLTGDLTAAGQWYQLALPLRWSQISGYDMYRCVGTVSAAEGDGAYLLFDRFRLLAKQKAVTGFQKRTTCIDNDSIYLISRIDYNSLELTPGKVICYQFQKWDDAQDKYVPMIASRKTGSNPDTYAAIEHTETPTPGEPTLEVFPGYYKIGMTRVESVTNPDFKSAVLKSDYGTIVVPEANYDPTQSGTSAGWSTARSNAIDYIQTLLGGDRSSYKNETGRIKSYSDIMTAQKFDFGEHGKFYVNEGTDANPHWVIYIIARVNVNSTENGTFRIALTSVDAVNSKPNFSDAACSNARVVRVQGSVDMLIDGATGWPNKDRATLTSEGNLIPANTTKTLSLRYNAPSDAVPNTTTECRFDLVRAFAFMDGYIDMTPEQQAAADLEWLRIYGCTVGDFQEAMNVFRAEDPANPNRKETNWANVTKESFHWLVGEQYTQAHADSMYNILNRLIVHDRLMEVGLSSRDISLGNEQDLYFYVRPIAASGVYTTLTKDGSRDSIAEGIICNAPIWLELHSASSPDSLRFGYDKKFGDSFAIPVIRATKTAANSALSVRVAAISDHAVIGWDSTHVVESNDPEWNRRMASLDNKPTFRYTQDRIVQERLYSGYYKQEEAVIFRPVDAAHITRLNRTDCECLNYDANGTTYDPATPRAKDAAGTNVFVRPAASPINGCNEWHVLPQTSDPSPKNHIPGYQIPNNFELKAGYWYKFKTTFFNSGSFISYNTGDNPSGAHTAYFILAIVPDTVRWTPRYTDRTNYWNDDNNWTAVVNGADFNGSLATVPLEDSRTIIEPLADQSYLPVVNYDSLGLKEWGFKTATCKDILFKKHSQILGQEKLTYTGKAFIDVIINQGNWQTFSPALKYVYSGDIYIPETPANDKDFLPEKFEKGSDWGEYHNRTWPYAFYQAYYNSTVPFAFQNTDKDGALDTDTKSPKNSAEWVKTNVLDQPLTPGKAVALLGFGPTEVEGTELIVRLPKQETSYHYISRIGSGWEEGSEVTLSRSAFGDISGNLEYDKTTLGNNDGVTYTLENALESKVFFFGNPTMSLIDVYRLCEDNKDLLEYTEGATNSYSFTTYNMKDGSTYNTEVVNAPGKYFIAPQRAIGLIAATPRTTLNIKLKPSALVALSAGGTIVHNIDPGAKKKEAPRAKTTDNYERRLYIAAANETNKGEYKAYVMLGESNMATRGFRKGEDAISLSSGSTYYNSSAFSTPLSMYTIADNQPLMQDLRDSIFSVPLVFATLDSVINAKGVKVWSKYLFDERTRLSFALEGDWDKALYLYDALTGDSILIVDGLQVGLQTPESDQIRYFINGGRRIEKPVVPDPVDPGISTNMESARGDEVTTENNHSTIIYDVLGRRLKVLGEYDLIQNIKLSTGVYILQRGDQTEKIVVR